MLLILMINVGNSFLLLKKLMLMIDVGKSFLLYVILSPKRFLVGGFNPFGEYARQIGGHCAK